MLVSQAKRAWRAPPLEKRAMYMWKKQVAAEGKIGSAFPEKKRLWRHFLTVAMPASAGSTLMRCLRLQNWLWPLSCSLFLSCSRSPHPSVPLASGARRPDHRRSAAVRASSDASGASRRCANPFAPASDAHALCAALLSSAECWQAKSPVPEALRLAARRRRRRAQSPRQQAPTPWHWWLRQGCRRRWRRRRHWWLLRPYCSSLLWEG